MTRCAYCGNPVRRRIDYTCTNCADLPELDPDVQRIRYRRWWLERYTIAELRVLAAPWAVPA
jgi:hypothetical protein